MTNQKNYLAVDLGAASGRVVLGEWDGARLNLREQHRFQNAPVRAQGHLYWNLFDLWREIKVGIAHSAHLGSLAGMGVDTWGVDYGLLDRAGNLLGAPYHYRDMRTDGAMECVWARVPRDQVFAQTGIQFMQLNTLYQLFSQVECNDPRLHIADRMLMIPDLIHYWLTGIKACEYTIASTTQMLDARTRKWATPLLDALNIPSHILPDEFVAPGTPLGELNADVQSELGLDTRAPVIAVACHDTASAVAAVPNLDATSAYISSGTWSLVGMEVNEPIINPRALRLNLTNEGGVNRTIRLLKNVAGLWLLQASQQHWQNEGHAYTWSDLQTLALQTKPLASLLDPDAHDFLNPLDMPTAIRAFCQRVGEPAPASVGAIVRACLESLALKYRWVIGALESLTNTRIETVRIVGGGSLNQLLCQFTADATGRIVLAGPVEATAIGNLLMQLIATGELSSLEQGRAMVAASNSLTRYEPRDTPSWDAVYARFLKINQLERN